MKDRKTNRKNSLIWIDGWGVEEIGTGVLPPVFKTRAVARDYARKQHNRTPLRFKTRIVRARVIITWKNP